MEIRGIEPFLDYWESVRGRTLRVIDRIPPDRLEWAPAEGRWSFGDIVRHLASVERDMYAETVDGRPSRYAGCGRDLADGAGAVRAFLDEKHVQALAIFRTLTPERLAAKCLTPAGTPITTYKWLRAMVEHEAHHRGQLYLMLGLLGVPAPPLYGLSEPEMRARSSGAAAG